MQWAKCLPRDPEELSLTPQTSYKSENGSNPSNPMMRRELQTRESLEAHVPADLAYTGVSNKRELVSQTRREVRTNT